jgi:molybdopterin synthase sulfur carrier subunit
VRLINLTGSYTTVGDVLNAVVEKYPEIRDKIFEGKKLVPFIKVLLNGLAVEVLNGLDTPVKTGDALAIFPPVGGG